MPGKRSKATRIWGRAALGLPAILASAASIAATAGAAAAAQRLPVLGFQEEEAPARLIDRNAHALSSVGIDGLNLTASAESLSAPTPAIHAQQLRARADHLEAVLLIGNYSEAIHDFSEPLAHSMLESAARRGAVIAQLAQIVRQEGWQGVSVDLESLNAADTEGLDAFLSGLHAALPASATLRFDLSNCTSEAECRASGYDLGAIAAAVNFVTLMGYDQHGPWERTPGPIGALAWQRAGIATLERLIPAAQIELGVAGYGYGWGAHRNVEVSDAQARAMAGRQHAQVHFMARLGEWTAKLRNGMTLWWSDARSIAARLRLARADHLHGVAIWSLGRSDPIPG